MYYFVCAPAQPSLLLRKPIMHTATLRKIGGSVGLSLPAPLVKSLAFKAGAQVEVLERDGEIVVKPCAPPVRRRYTLDQLLAQCDFSKRLGKEEREWLAAPRAGREAI